MKPELRAKIIAYNKSMAERAEKANDLDVIVAAMTQQSPVQLKEALSDEVLAVLAKYGINLE